MKSKNEWEQQYDTFYKAMSSLSDTELQSLTFIFECHPSYVGPVQKYHYIEYLWSKFRELRNGKEDSMNLRHALAVLRG